MTRSHVRLSGAPVRFLGAAMTAAGARFIGELGESRRLLLQSLFVSRIFEAIGPAGALFVGPAIALVGYSVILVAPVLGLVRVLKILDNSNQHSVQNTAHPALFCPVTREAKYKAKAGIDSLF